MPGRKVEKKDGNKKERGEQDKAKGTFAVDSGRSALGTLRPDFLKKENYGSDESSSELRTDHP